MKAGISFPNETDSINRTSNPKTPAKSHRKRPVVEIEEVEDVDSPPRKIAPKKQKANAATSEISSVRPWIDIPEPHTTKGRPADPLAREVSIYCYDARDASKAKCVRCVGSTEGCTTYWKGERNKGRVYKHASECICIESSLRQRVSAALSSKAPSAQVKASLEATSSASSSQPSAASAGTSKSTGLKSLSKPSVLDLAMASGRQQLKQLVDFDLVKYICAAGLPPTSVDRPEFKTMLEHLNSSYNPPSSTTIADTHIPAEAARVLEKSIDILKLAANLTLTLDGGSTRRSCSVYTFHVSTPERRAFLMRGEDVSAQSHTGDFIANLALEILKQVGPDQFSAVVTDGAANVVRARKILVDKFPTILNLTDPCHKLSLLIKDICKLEEFKVPISNLRRSLNFFHKSDFATALLTARRSLLGILCGLVKIGLTRFGTVVIAADSMLTCLPAIRELVSEGAFEVKFFSLYGVNHLFMANSPASLKFEMQLTVLTAPLNPLVRAITCLESASCTPADVLLFFSAALGCIDRHLSSGSHGLSNSQTVIDIRRLCNKRFNELINESRDDIYVTAFYLDTYYRNSKLLRNINPLTIKLTLNSSAEFSSHAPTAAMITRIGTCIMNMLKKEWDANPHGFVRSLYPNPRAARDALRQQLLLYGCSAYPFSENIQENTPALSWWTALADHPMSKLLAYFAIKLFSITANSMADERTVSTFTWLNSALRSRQDVATIVRQTQIRQFYGLGRQAKEPVRIRYRELKRKQKSEAAKSKTAKTVNSEINPESDESEYPEDADKWLDEIDEPLPTEITGETMGIGELVDLDAPEVEDCLSDEMPTSLQKRKLEEGIKGSASGGEEVMGEGDSSEIEWAW